jgi:uncharacterized protein
VRTGSDRAGVVLLLVVAGTRAGSLWQSKELHSYAAGPKELVLIDGATHMDLYDGKGRDAAP